jgi:hypothetical protein
MAVQIPNIIQYIGLGCSSAVIIILAILALVDITYVNRVTVRLVAGIAIADFIGHISVILILDSKEYIGTSYCRGLAAMTTVARIMYALTNVAICYHLYRAIVYLKKSSFKYELMIWSLLMAATGIIVVVFHFLGVFKENKDKLLCTPGSDVFAIQMVENAVAGLLNIIAVFAGIYTTYIGHRYISQWINKYSNKQMPGGNNQPSFKAKKRKTVQRSFLYPLSTVITLSSELVTCIWSLFGNPTQIIKTFNRYTTGFKGILTFIAFIVDPAVCDSLRSAYRKITLYMSGNYKLVYF